MPTIPLPEDPSLEHLKSQAKLARDLIRGGDQGALSMIDELHPRLESADLDAEAIAAFKLSDAQLLVARLYGFASWSRLRDHLDIVAAHSHTPLAERSDATDDEPFVALACLSYAVSGPGPVDRLERARALLAADPSVATGSIAAYATVGDHEALAAALDAEPAAVNAKCGANDWPPILYCTYSRIGGDRADRSALATLDVLLERGADPNAGFLWRGLVPPFTTLTGAFGGGESRQSWHPDRLALARRLLEAGADPNDGQGLYNNGIGGQNHDDPSHLELLVEYGLGTERGGPWYELLGDRLRDPAELLYDELEAAALRNRPAILAYLISLGLDLDRPVGRSGKTPARIAAEHGHTEISELLASAGIDANLRPVEEALGMIRVGDTSGLERLLDAERQLIDESRRGHPDAIKLVSADDPEMLVLLIELGFDINIRSGGSGTTALHEAAHAGDLALVRLLVAHGADPDATDRFVDATPLSWANHFHHDDVAAYLQPITNRDQDTD